MGILDKVLGRRTRNAANIAKEIAAQEEAIVLSQKKIEQAQLARKTAIEDFDDVRHKAADDDIAAARRDIERREAAIEALKAAHVKRIDIEAREAFQAEDAAMARAGAALSERVTAEYRPAAEKIAQLVDDLAAFHEKRKRLLARGVELGESATCEDPEDFRGVEPKMWSARWPSTDGTHSIQGSVEDAPEGSIRWVGEKPISDRKDVEVIFKGGGGRLNSLVDSIGDLPGLLIGEGMIHAGRSLREFWKRR